MYSMPDTFDQYKKQKIKLDNAMRLQDKKIKELTETNMAVRNLIENV